MVLHDCTAEIIKEATSYYIICIAGPSVARLQYTQNPLYRSDKLLSSHDELITSICHLNSIIPSTSPVSIGRTIFRFLHVLALGMEVDNFSPSVSYGSSPINPGPSVANSNKICGASLRIMIEE